MTMMESMMIKKLKEIKEMEPCKTPEKLKEKIDFSFNEHKRFLDAHLFTVDHEGVYNFCKEYNYDFFTYNLIEFWFDFYSRAYGVNP